MYKLTGKEGEPIILLRGGIGMDDMNMTETARLILDLRAKGWSDTEIMNHILYIVTGDQSYKAEKTD